MSYRIERDRGIKEYRQQLAQLREKWPLAFPVNDKDIRPLTVDATREIAAAKGWSLPYTLGVLSRWKMAPVYCQSILCYDQRIALDGTPAEMVGAKAKDLASKHLARFAAGAAAKKAAKSGARWGEAETYRRATSRDTARDAGAIALPCAGGAPASERVAALWRRLTRGK